MFKRGVAIFVAIFSIFTGVIWYNAYLPISPKLANDEKLIPFLMNLSKFLSQIIGEKLGIVPRYKVFRWFLTAASNMDIFSDPEGTAKEVEIKDSVISGVPVKIFQLATPEGGSQPHRPGLLFIHGGGLVFGSVNWKSYIQQFIILARDTKSILIAMEYRLAPEHAFPAQFEDCFTVVQTVADDPSRFGIIPNKIALIGDSSGGMLTAAISLEFAKQRRSSELVAQVLICPWLQLIDILCLHSYQEYKRGFQLDEEQAAYFTSIVTMGSKDMAQAYLNGSVTRYFIRTPFWKFLEIPKNSKCNIFKENTNRHVDLPPAFIEKVVDPRLSPLLANSLEGSPATLMVIPEYDILSSEGILYAKRLKAAGVPVVSKMYKTYHSFLHGLALPFINKTIANEGMLDIVNYLNSVYYT